MEAFTKWNISIQNISKQLSGWDKSEHIKANTSTNAPNM
jgi:hypothetical protein